MASTTNTPALADVERLTLPAIPGLRFRGWAGETDFAGMARAGAAARRSDGEPAPMTIEGLTNRYLHLERSDLRTDLLVVEIDAEIVGFARVEWSDVEDERWYESVCVLDPAVRRRGIGTAMLDWTEARRSAIRTEQHGPGVEPGGTPMLMTFCHDGDVGARRLLSGRGYEPFRQFFTLCRPTLDDVDVPPVPDGLEIRTFGSDRPSLRRVFDADSEAFRDHWGWTEPTEREFEEFVGDPTTDPSLWVIAVDGDEIAGGIINGIHPGPDGTGRVGWLDSVFTRRPWRRRGLARALVARSLVRLREAGMREAYLGVDSTNPNEALHLYESAGFALVASGTAWRRPFEASER